MTVVSMFLSARDMSMLEAFLYAIVGFVIVLAVLALLVGIFYLSGFLFRSKLLGSDKRSERKNKKAPAVVSSDEDDEELVAAVTAAIAVILESESDEDVKPEFVIRRIVRKQ